MYKYGTCNFAQFIALTLEALQPVQEFTAVICTGIKLAVVAVRCITICDKMADYPFSHK